MKIGNHDFDLINNSYIMGILNVTPDSFSDGGKYARIDDALFRAEEMITEGASIIDIGGESTRPGHIKVTAQEEIERVVPVLEALKRNIDVPVSLDTWKYEVAAAGISAGADLINDVNGLLYDEGQMAELIARSDLPCCLMHNGRLAAVRARSNTKLRDDKKPGDNTKSIDDTKCINGVNRRKDVNPVNYLDLFLSDIDRIISTAHEYGIKKERIILDPGIGFGKNLSQNLTIMNNLSLMKQWDLPVLLGTSRKTMIGQVLDLPVDEREEGTLVTTVMGRMAGISIFRVHNVEANYRALKMADAILHN